MQCWKSKIDANGDVFVEGHLVGQLAGFRFSPAAGGDGADAKAVQSAAQKALALEFEARAARLHAAGNGDLALSSEGHIRLAWSPGRAFDGWRSYPPASRHPACRRAFDRRCPRPGCGAHRTLCRSPYLDCSETAQRFITRQRFAGHGCWSGLPARGKSRHSFPPRCRRGREISGSAGTCLDAPSRRAFRRVSHFLPRSFETGSGGDGHIAVDIAERRRRQAGPWRSHSPFWPLDARR